jgi:hypothetical protein
LQGWERRAKAGETPGSLSQGEDSQAFVGKGEGRFCIPEKPGRYHQILRLQHVFFLEVICGGNVLYQPACYQGIAKRKSWGYILGEMRGSFTRRKHATSSFSEWGDHRMEWKMIPKLVFYLLLGALFLSGCGSDTLDFKIRYQEISGLRKDDRVLFEERHIGDVKDVKYTSQGDYLVDVSISKEFANDITEHSRFYVSLDPKDMERQAVHMVRIKDGGAPLQKNAIVAGTTKYAVLFDQFGVGLRDNLKRFESELNDLIESFRYLSESEQIKRSKRNWTVFLRTCNI